jgi:hypothetical protein
MAAVTFNINEMLDEIPITVTVPKEKLDELIMRLENIAAKEQNRTRVQNVIIKETYEKISDCEYDVPVKQLNDVCHEVNNVENLKKKKMKSVVHMKSGRIERHGSHREKKDKYGRQDHQRRPYDHITTYNRHEQIQRCETANTACYSSA